MPPSDARSPRRGRHARGGKPLPPPESLESRELLAYSPLGFSLPDLTLQAYSANVGAWGEQLAVTADVFNIGASSITEPFNQIPNGDASTGLPGQGAPGSSHANAPPTVIDVFASTRPGKAPFAQVGVLNVPAIAQNAFTVVSGDVTLPAKPAGFPAAGKIYLTYVIDGDNTILEASAANNAFKSHQAVTLTAALPNLQVTGFVVPTPLVPGQTITPIIQIANLGTAPTGEQGPVTVEIIASTDKNFGPGDKVLATYTVGNIPPLSAVSTTVPFTASLNVQTPSNVVTLGSMSVTLPSTPNIYFLGVKVDPAKKLRQLGFHSSSQFDAVVKVGPPIPGLPPTAISTTGTGTGTGTGTVTPYQFPDPLPGASSPGGAPTTTTTTTATAAFEAVSPQRVAAAIIKKLF